MVDRPDVTPLVQDTILGEALLSAFDAAGCGVVVSDDDFNIVAVNQVIADLLGYSREEMVRLKARDVTGRPDFRETDPVYEQLRQGDQVFDEAVLRRRDGRVGRIKFRAMNGTIGPLPVLVSLTREVTEFVLDPEPS